MKQYTAVILLISFLLVHADYLVAVSSNNCLLVWVTENGTVTTVGNSTSIPSVTNPTSIVSQYYMQGQTYYALHDSKYLFSYNVATTENKTLPLIVVQETTLATLCVSQQFGTLYAIQVQGLSVVVVQVSHITGSISNAALPVAISSISSSIEQCIVDDAFSRVLWSYKDSTSYYIVSTDILPQYNGATTLLSSSSLQEVWLFFDWSAETFYATSINSDSPQLWEMSIAIDGVKMVELGTVYKAVSITSAQGAMNSNTGVISVFSEGIIAQANIENSTWSHFNMEWGALGEMIVNPKSVAWVAQDSYL